jgi:hypothetical protein
MQLSKADMFYINCGQGMVLKPAAAVDVSRAACSCSRLLADVVFLADPPFVSPTAPWLKVLLRPSSSKSESLTLEICNGIMLMPVASICCHHHHDVLASFLLLFQLFHYSSDS